jgi:hypothetical protein
MAAPLPNGVYLHALFDSCHRCGPWERGAPLLSGSPRARNRVGFPGGIKQRQGACSGGPHARAPASLAPAPGAAARRAPGRARQPVPRPTPPPAPSRPCLGTRSGSILDLPFETRYDKSGAAYWKQSRMYGTAGGTAFSLGACE